MIVGDQVNRKFEIANDRFWKDGEPFQIIGGDVHYFRVHPEVLHFLLASLSLMRGIFNNSHNTHHNFVTINGNIIASSSLNMFWFFYLGILCT